MGDAPNLPMWGAGEHPRKLPEESSGPGALLRLKSEDPPLRFCGKNCGKYYYNWLLMNEISIHYCGRSIRIWDMMIVLVQENDRKVRPKSKMHPFFLC